MSFETEFQRAQKANQAHIFSFYHELDTEKQDQLVRQVKTIDYKLLNTLYESTKQEVVLDFSTMQPPHVINNQIENKEAHTLGLEAIKKGEIAFFTVAGGQGSRLGYDGPKGCYAASPVKKKTLFELFANKILATNKKYGIELDWYIMTSQANNEQTIDYFKAHKYFGLEKNIVFFSQDMLPAVDQEGKLLLEEQHKIFMSPNGTGGIFTALHKNNILKRMKEKNILYLSYFQVDNPLINFMDELFLGHHIQEQADISTKVVRKSSWDERVGVLAKKDEKITIVEYVHMSEVQAKQKNSDGSLTFSAGNIAAHIINRNFIKKMVEIDLGPYTAAFKKIAHHHKERGHVQPNTPNAYKFERFVFDALAHAKNSVVFEVLREEEFAPIKNATGNDSPATSIQLQNDLAKSWMTYAGFSQKYIDSLTNVEINPEFALNKEEFKHKVESSLSTYEASKETDVYFT